MQRPQAKQKWGLSVERGFAPTSNARNEKMFQEAARFEGQLRQFEKDLKLWQKDVDGACSDASLAHAVA